MSRRRDRPVCLRRTRTGSPRRCGWPSNWAARRSPCRARTSPRRSSATRRPTMSPTSSSASRNKSRWRRTGSTARSPHDLIRHAGDISVHVIAGEDRERRSASQRRVKTRLEASAVRDLALSACAPSMSACALGFGMLLDRLLDVRNIALVFLMAVLTSAVTDGSVAGALSPASISALSPSISSSSQPLYTLDDQRSGKRRRASASSSWSPSSPAI